MEENKATLDRYKHDGELVINVKKILAVGFVPIRDVRFAYLILTSIKFFMAITPILHHIIEY